MLVNESQKVNASASIEVIPSGRCTLANKSCPGEWMYSRMCDLADKVTAALGGASTPSVPGTNEEPSTLTTADLKKGDSGEAVKTMQTMLIACGYDCGFTGADGKFGDKTLAGLRAFQKEAGLTVDGLYGSASKTALEKVYANLPAVNTPAAPSTPITPTTPTTGESREQIIWDTLFAAIGNTFGVAGLMGNLYAESGLNPQNLQNNGNNKLGMTDAEFTAAFDSGAYAADAFIHDGYGYGLAQWTYYSRKQALLNYAKAAGKSIGDLTMQLGFLLQEIKCYKTVWNTICNAASVREASDAVLLRYEKPADQSESAQTRRAGYGQKYYDKYAQPADPDAPKAPAGKEDTYLIRVTNPTLNCRKGPGMEYDSYGYIAPGVYTIVDEQNGWGLLKGYAKYRNGWISLEYTEKIDG